MAKRKITAQVDPEMLALAVAIVGENNISATVREGLRRIVEGPPEMLAEELIVVTSEEPLLDAAVEAPPLPVKPTSEMSETERTKWKRELGDVFFRLTQVQGELEGRLVDTPTAEQPLLRAKIADLQAVVSKIEKRMNTIGSAEVKMPPPTDAVIGDIKEKVKAVEDKTAQAARADAVVAAARDLAKALGAA